MGLMAEILGEEGVGEVFTRFLQSSHNVARATLTPTPTVEPY
jgi:hypothetical protein